MDIATLGLGCDVSKWDAAIIGTTPTPTGTPTATATPPPGANMKFIEIKPYEVKEIPGPLEYSAHITLVNKDWTFKNDGAASEKMRIDIDELDASGNIIKNIAPYVTNESVPPGGPYRVGNDMPNAYDFSRRYVIDDTIYLAVSIWGKDTESKPAPPYTELAAIKIIRRY